MCKSPTVSRSQANNRVLQFDNIIEDIVNRLFHMTIPAAFKKFEGTTRTAYISKKTNKEGGSGGSGREGTHGCSCGGHRKRRFDQHNGQIVQNAIQLEKIKMTTGKNGTTTSHYNVSRNIPIGTRK
jgi:hypothetical protein